MKYIPQAEPFIMIEELLSATEKITVTSTQVKPGNIFVHSGVFTEPGLIENIAQTIAAGSGFKAAQNREKPPVGYIGAIKNWDVTYLPKVGETITTSVEVLHEVLNARIVKGEITCNGVKAASVEIKIFLQ